MVQKVQNCFQESPNLPKKSGSDVRKKQANSRRTGPFSLPLQEPNHSLTPNLLGLINHLKFQRFPTAKCAHPVSASNCLSSPHFFHTKNSHQTNQQQKFSSPSTQGPGLDLCTFLTQNATNKPGSSTNLAEAPKKIRDQWLLPRVMDREPLHLKATIFNENARNSQKF